MDCQACKGLKVTPRYDGKNEVCPLCGGSGVARDASQLVVVDPPQMPDIPEPDSLGG